MDQSTINLYGAFATSANDLAATQKRHDEEMAATKAAHDANVAALVAIMPENQVFSTVDQPSPLIRRVGDHLEPVVVPFIGSLTAARPAADIPVTARI